MAAGAVASNRSQRRKERTRAALIRAAQELIAAGRLNAPVLEITQAADGMAALAATQAEAFDVIFMDVRMPELDGRETTRRLRATAGANQFVPVIAVTADTSDEDVKACAAAGMTWFVAKPLTPATLLGALEAVLTGQAALDAPESQAA